MCVAMATIGMIGSIASTAMSVMGSIQQGKAAKAQANYQAQVATNNAKIAEWQAQDSEARGKIAENEQRAKVRQFVGGQRAAIGGSGFEFGDDTSLSLLGDAAAMGEYDALVIRNNAAREAWGYRTQGSNFTAQAGAYGAAGKNAMTSAYMTAGADLLGGASKFATQYGKSSTTLPWQTSGNVKPSWMGGGFY